MGKRTRDKFVTRGRMITIGSFDGVHLGHHALLEKTVVEGKKRGYKTMALTFGKPPRMVLEKKKFHLLTTPFEKEVLLKKSKMNEVHFLNFNHKLSSLRPFGFFKKILLEQFNAKGLVVGLDFRFGQGRSAGATELVRWGQEFEIPVWVISAVKKRSRIVSSTYIRQLLLQNKFNEAKAFLGHPLVVQGPVVRGRGVGRNLGFPTANIRVDKDKVIPRGVFAVRLRVLSKRNGKLVFLKNKPMKGVCNIGVRPTFKKASGLSFEVHMFSRDVSLRGKQVYVELVKKLRSEKKFSSVEALKKAIQADIKKARVALSKSKQKHPYF